MQKDTKFEQIVVVQFLNGKTAETFESDEDVRTGRKTNELAGKTRIVWDLGMQVEWVKSDKLVKLDNRHLQYI